MAGTPRARSTAPRKPRKPAVSPRSAAESELQALGVLDTPDGQAVLRVAAAMSDCEPRDLAALSRELRLSLAAIRATAAVTADAVDDLKAKRERRRRAS